MIVYVSFAINVVQFVLFFIIRRIVQTEVKRLNKEFKETADKKDAEVKYLKNLAENLKGDQQETTQLKERNLLLMRQITALKNQKESEKSVENNKSSDLGCVVCFEPNQMTCYIPCYHVSTCTLCARAMSPQQCPICRESRGKFQPLFDARSNNSSLEEEKHVVCEVEVEKRKGIVKTFWSKIKTKL